MKKDSIENLFDNLKHEFNVEEPTENHKKRFMKKLNNQDIVAVNMSKRNLWKPFIGIAASIAILVTVFVGTQPEETANDLASISQIGRASCRERV